MTEVGRGASCKLDGRAEILIYNFNAKEIFHFYSVPYHYRKIDLSLCWLKVVVRDTDGNRCCSVTDSRN